MLSCPAGTKKYAPQRTGWKMSVKMKIIERELLHRLMNVQLFWPVRCSLRRRESLFSVPEQYHSERRNGLWGSIRFHYGRKSL